MFKPNKIPKFFTMTLKNTYYFKWSDMEVVGACMQKGSLDALHAFCLLEIHPTNGCIAGRFKDAYRVSGKAYDTFLTSELNKGS